MRGYFVTGTDTGVGKTYTTCALARRAKGRVFAFKPIETGCERIDGALVGDDQRLLVQAAGGWQHGELRGVYQLELPLAPLVAAERAGVTIDFGRIEKVLAAGAAEAELTLVEGAGGWRVPITRKGDMSTLAQRVGLPVIIVARAGLGTINHTLLTVEAVERDGLKIAAVVLSRRPDESSEAARSNIEQIHRVWPGRVMELGPDLDQLL
jgi:dethiobiotin synthetase